MFSSISSYSLHILNTLRRVITNDNYDIKKEEIEMDKPFKHYDKKTDTVYDRLYSYNECDELIVIDIPRTYKYKKKESYL
tara:strand:- start:2794 stop:3033 length:240 start_codon:yes stop_codon:yes gene_type:complete